MALLDKEIDNEAERELGPLKYLAETTGKDMGTVVNWFLLLIIFVFDPLAIALVIAANMAFAQIKRKGPEVVMSVPEGMEFNTPYPIPAEEATEEVHEGKQLQKGIDAAIEVIEEEVKQKETLDENQENKSEPEPLKERKRSGGYWS